MDYGKRTDANHLEVKRVFEENAQYVIDCANLGAGFADLLVLTRDGALLMIEIKDGRKKPSERKLTKRQCETAKAMGDAFLVSTDNAQAVAICTLRTCRGVYSGINYIERPW